MMVLRRSSNLLLTCTLAVVSSSSAGCSRPGLASDATDATLGQGSSLIELDCRPRIDERATYETHCQYIGAEPQTIVCPQSNGAPGSLVLRVLDPATIRPGQSVPLGGAPATVTLELAAATPTNLVQTNGPGGMGMVVFDQFEVGKIMKGHLQDASVTALPDPAFQCHLSEATFLADWGPGVTSK